MTTTHRNESSAHRGKFGDDPGRRSTRPKRACYIQYTTFSDRLQDLCSRKDGKITRHIQLVKDPTIEPGAIQLEINISSRRARLYVHESTPTTKIEALVDEHADEIAGRLDAWGID